MTCFGFETVGQEFLRFDETFFDYWGQHMEMGTNYFRDPVGNYLMLEFEESFMQNRSFRIAREISNFYNLDDLYWLGILYCGHCYFQIRIFSLAMKEIEYPAPRLLPNPQQPLSSSRFFTCFKSELLLPQVYFNVDIT